jgi:hypothetical protein
LSGVPFFSVSIVLYIPVEEAVLLPLNHIAIKLYSSQALPSLILRTASSETTAVRHLSNLINRSEGQIRPSSYSTMSASASSTSSDDVPPRGQQPMLASQRAKEQSRAPTEANRTGRFTGYFPLGYKEGFSQWVRENRHVAFSSQTNDRCSGPISLQLLPSTMSCLLFHTSRSRPHTCTQALLLLPSLRQQLP